MPRGGALRNQRGQRVKRAAPAEHPHEITTPEGYSFGIAHGRVTGREAPRLPHRANRMSDILVSHGLMDPGEAMPTQGVMFHDRRTNTISQVMAREHVPERRASSGEGFLSSLGNVAGTKDPEQRHKIAKQKLDVLQRAHDVGGGFTMREGMANRETYVREGREDKWYSERAPQGISREAARTHVTEPEMRRSVAYMSAQKPWDEGHPQDSTYRETNLVDASSLVEHVRAARAHAHAAGAPLSEVHAEAMRAAAEHRAPSKQGGLRQVQTGANRAKVGRVIGGQEDPGSRMKSTPGFEKIPNFDLALASGSESRTVRREAHQAYTSDTHDIRTMFQSREEQLAGKSKPTLPGGRNIYKLYDKPGSYDIASMTGRRTAMRHGMTPSQLQENVWVTRNDPSQAKAVLVAGKGNDLSIPTVARATRESRGKK